jgi:hypothetical protein
MVKESDTPAPTSMAKWLAQNPPAPQRFSFTLGSVAAARTDGEEFRFAVREFWMSSRFDPFCLKGPR